MKSVFENKTAWLIVVAACVMSIILVSIRDEFWSPPNVAFAVIAFLVSIPQISLFIRKRIWNADNLSVAVRVVMLLSVVVVSAVVFFFLLKKR